MDFMLPLPICTHKHQILIILTNPTSDIWILRLKCRRADVISGRLIKAHLHYIWHLGPSTRVSQSSNAIETSKLMFRVYTDQSLSMIFVSDVRVRARRYM